MFNFFKCEKDKWQENKNHNSNMYNVNVQEQCQLNFEKVKKWGIFKL